jgi:hypothetical protein
MELVGLIREKNKLKLKPLKLSVFYEQDC